MKKSTFVLSAVALSLGIALGPMVGAVESTPTVAAPQQLPSLAPMLERIMPSVVRIDVEGSTSTSVKNVGIPPQFQQFFEGDDSPFCQPGSPFSDSPLCMGSMGEGRMSTKQKFRGVGSGVIIDADKGYVVTNNHVLQNADSIKVQLTDGRRFDAKIIGKDPRTDIALVQLKDANKLTAIKMADSDALRVGDYTVAIGNPYGLGETVTSGIVSALGRSGLNMENYEDFIQTDAAINQGNSGGALVNLNGELIGINTAILAPGGGNIGIGFAIPSNMVKSLTSQMVQFGQVKRGELGILGTELNPELGKAMKVDAQRGAFVSQVVPNSSAARAGIKAGDVIVTMNDKPINSFASFRAQLGSMPVGSKMKLGIIRDGKTESVEVTLEQSKQSNQVASANLFSGIEGAELSNVPGQKGVRIDSVRKGSAAAHIGLQKGDIIRGANQQSVENIGDLRKIMSSKPTVLALNIQRGDTSLYLLMQ